MIGRERFGELEVTRQARNGWINEAESDRVPVCAVDERSVHERLGVGAHDLLDEDRCPGDPNAVDDVVRADLAAGGFVSRARFEALEARSRAETCHVPAIGFCQGTPLRNAIEARDPARLEEATSAAAAAIAQRFGPTDIDGKMRAYVITVNKP